MTAMLISSESLRNPVDVAELIVMDRDWNFDRLDDGELVAETSGVWCHYRLWLNWQEEMGRFTLSCAFDNKVPRAALPKVYALLALANEKIWLGHFDLQSETQSVVFRHCVLVPEGSGTDQEQMQQLLDIAVQECERFYPAFQAVTWGGKAPEEALQLALFETIAEA